VLIALGGALVVTPWEMRNYMVFHALPPLAVGGTGSGLGNLIREIDGGEEGMIASTAASAPQTRAEYLNNFVDGAALIEKEKLEAVHNRQELARRRLPFLRTMVYHVPRLWLTQYAIQRNSLVATIGFVTSWLLIVPGIAGMLLARRRWRALLPLYGMVIFITLMYVPAPVEARYTLPARPAMVCFAAVALCWWVERMMRKPHADHDRGAVAAVAQH